MCPGQLPTKRTPKHNKPPEAHTSRTATAACTAAAPSAAGGGGMVPVPDRCVALLPYLVPLLDGLRYSRFFFQQFPSTIFLLQPLQPLAAAYYSIPFASLVSFFAIYLGLAENKNMSRFVRFNAMQAIIVDVCMVLPGMVEYGTALGVFQIRRHCLQPLYSECNK